MQLDRGYQIERVLAVDLSLPESSLANVAVGQAAVVTVAALGGAQVPATVSYVSPRVREDSTAGTEQTQPPHATPECE